MDSKRLTDAFKQIPLQIFLLIISGLIAVFAMMIPGLLFKAIAWFSNGSSAGRVVGFDHMITGAIGLIASVIAMYQFMKKPGVDGAIYAQRADGDNAKLNPLYPAIIILLSMVVYTLICIIADFQFVAGPVQYFAPYFGKVVDTAGMGDVGFIYKLIGYIILIVFEIPAMYLGYVKGFKERLSGNSLL